MPEIIRLFENEDLIIKALNMGEFTTKYSPFKGWFVSMDNMNVEFRMEYYQFGDADISARPSNSRIFKWMWQRLDREDNKDQDIRTHIGISDELRKELNTMMDKVRKDRKESQDTEDHQRRLAYVKKFREKVSNG